MTVWDGHCKLMLLQLDDGGKIEIVGLLPMPPWRVGSFTRLGQRVQKAVEAFNAELGEERLAAATREERERG